MRFTYDNQPTIHETVFQAMGFASVCWDKIENAGVFQGVLAETAGTEAITAIRAIVTYELSRLLDASGEATDWNEAIEAALVAMEKLK